MPHDTPPPGDADLTRAPAPSDGPGEQIGPYRLLQKIGEGGMGEVWVAEQREPIRRTVALKVIKVGMDTREVVARFESERQALALMDHPVIAKVFDAGATAQGRPYFVMEYVKGEPITAYCDRQRLSTTDRLALFMRVCDGVQHAHQKGIIHRDLKPSNVLVAVQDSQAVPKIIDFGVAKATAQRLTERTLFTELGMMVGTPEYMSPEQAEMTGLDVDTRTDVYSLGVMLYELLVGALPFDPKALRQAGLDEVRRQIREVDPPRPSTKVSTSGDASAIAARNRRTEPTRLASQLRGDLDWITMKALEKDRTRRYDTAVELANDVGRYLRHEPVSAGPPSAAYRTKKFVRRHRLAVGAAAALMIVLAAFGVTMAVQARRIARERDRANLEAEAANEVSEFLVKLFEVSDPGENRGSTVTARELLDKAARDIERRLEDQPLVKARLEHTMARVYLELGLNGEVLKLADRAARTRRARGDDQGTGGSLSLMGKAYLELGQFDKAEAVLNRARDVQEKRGAPEGVGLAETLNTLGGVHMFRAEYEEAAIFYRRALAIREARLGRSHPSVGETLNDFANVRYEQRNYAEAEALYRRAVAIWENAWGHDHPWVAIGLTNLGNVCSDLQRYGEAETLFRRSLEIREKVLGPGHYQTVSTLRGLAAVLVQQGRYQLAEPLLERALETLVKTSRQEHPEYAATLWWLAGVYRDRGQYGRAEPLYRRAVAVMEGSFGPIHPDVARAVCLLGLCQLAAGKLDEARPLLRQALRIAEASPNSPGDVRSRSHGGLALDLLTRGAHAEAAAEYRRALTAAEQTFGAGDLETAETKARLAAVLRQMGKDDEAAALIAQALQVERSASARGLKSQSERLQSVVVLLLADRPADARAIAETVFATGYRHRPFLALCGRYGIAPQPDAGTRDPSTTTGS